jgi:hypothetical protein
VVEEEGGQLSSSKLERMSGYAVREAAAGDPRRLKALEDLEESVRRRLERGA